MSRSRARVTWMITAVLLVVGLLVALQLVSSTAERLQQQRSALAASQQELENTSRLSVALAELDRLTINENTATRLEILRHLGLEKNDYDVNLGARTPRPIGNVTLVSRQVRIIANLTYAEALALADRLYNNRQLNLTGVRLGNANARYLGAEVEITIDGTLYGIDKRGGQS